MKLSIITVAIHDFNGLCKTVESIPVTSDVQHIVKLVPNDINPESLSSLYPHLDIVVSTDSGIYDAMNQALSFVKSSYVLFLNVRDYLIPGSLPFVLHLLKFANTRSVFKFMPVIHGRPVREIASLLYYSKHMLNHQTILYPINYFSYCNFNPSCKVVADLRHLLESNAYQHISYIDLPLVEYDMSSNFALRFNSIYNNWLERFSSYSWDIPFIYKIVLTSVAILGLIHVTTIRRLRNLLA